VQSILGYTVNTIHNAHTNSKIEQRCDLCSYDVHHIAVSEQS